MEAPAWRQPYTKFWVMWPKFNLSWFPPNADSDLQQNSHFSGIEVRWAVINHLVRTSANKDLSSYTCFLMFSKNTQTQTTLCGVTFQPPGRLAWNEPAFEGSVLEGEWLSRNPTQQRARCFLLLFTSRESPTLTLCPVSLLFSEWVSHEIIDP